MSNCFDCNNTGIDKDFGSACHCGVAAAGTARVLSAAEIEVGALADWLAEQTWSEFAQSIANFYQTKGYMSPKQEAAARSMKAKCDTKASKATAPATASAAPAVTIPSGHYALRVEGVVKFYKVNSPTEGKWAGYTFVDAQASDEFFPIKNRETKAEILKAISADVKAALVLYGHSLGVCGVCRRTLTDETSRAAGIGPICANRL